MVSIFLFNLGLWDGLMALYWGMRMYQTGLSSSQDKFSCSSKRSFVLISFMIWFWIGPPHEPTDCTGRVGRQPTELPFFSFMAGWEREGGQWFQHALVGSRLYQSHWTAMLPFHIHAFSSDQNSRMLASWQAQTDCRWGGGLKNPKIGWQNMDSP